MWTCGIYALCYYHKWSNPYSHNLHFLLIWWGYFSILVKIDHIIDEWTSKWSSWVDICKWITYWGAQEWSLICCAVHLKWTNSRCATAWSRSAEWLLTYLFPGFRAGPWLRWQGALSSSSDACTRLSEPRVCKGPGSWCKHSSLYWLDLNDSRVRVKVAGDRDLETALLGTYSYSGAVWIVLCNSV